MSINQIKEPSQQAIPKMKKIKKSQVVNFEAIYIQRGGA